MPENILFDSLYQYIIYIPLVATNVFSQITTLYNMGQSVA